MRQTAVSLLIDGGMVFGGVVLLLVILGRFPRHKHTVVRKLEMLRRKKRPWRG